VTQLSLFSGKPTPAPTPMVPLEDIPGLVDTEEKAMRAIMVLLRNPGAFTLDTETDGLMPYSAKTPSRICGVAIGYADTDEHDQYWSFRHKEGNNLPLWWLQVLVWLLADREIIGHNIKFDIHMFLVEGMGFKIPRKLKCSQIAAHTANENFRQYHLKGLCEILFGKESIKNSTELMAELKKRKAGKEAIHVLPAAMVAAYAIDDLRLCRRLLAWAELRVARWGLSAILLERFAYQCGLIRCEKRGLPLDEAETIKQISELQPKIADYKARMWRMQQDAGFTKPVNVNSPKQLKEWLKLQSTKKDLLLEILQSTPREDLQTLLDYRKVSKSEGTYFRPFLEMVDADGRLHTGFKVHGTVTWRLSSAEPNLQNCSPFVKNCFRAPPGWKLAELDYSAIEPRLAAHYTEDPDLIDTFWQGKDFHTTTARKMYKIDGVIEKDSKARKDAKILGLGAIYNLGSYKMCKSLGLRHDKKADGTWVRHEELVWALNIETGQLVQKACSDQDAEFCTCLGRDARRDFYLAIPTLGPTIKAVQATAKRNKYIRIPLFGTVQRFDRKRARNGWVKSFNALIQHTAAMLLMRAFLALDEMLGDGEDCQIVGTIHDSIILLVRDDEHMKRRIREVKDVMEQTTKLRVPCIADVKVGTSLANMVEVHV
jgi:DNA polymerase I-like protein with 3'-5' exonuclease and polymerase domains